MTLGPGPEQSRRRIYDLVQRGGAPGVHMRIARNLSSKWHTLYSRTLIGRDGSDEPDYEKARPQIERVIAEFFENDYWPMVNAIRAEFGLSPASSSSAISATID